MSASVIENEMLAVQRAKLRNRVGLARVTDAKVPPIPEFASADLPPGLVRLRL